MTDGSWQFRAERKMAGSIKSGLIERVKDEQTLESGKRKRLSRVSI